MSCSKYDAALCGAGKLTFELGGADETQGTMTATQQHMNRHFSLELPSTLFHSQQSVLKLLEATDSEFTDALSTLVDVSLWQACEHAARAREKAAVARANTCAGSRRTLAAAAAASARANTALQVRPPRSIARPTCLGFTAANAPNVSEGQAEVGIGGARRERWRSPRRSCAASRRPPPAATRMR